MHIRDTQCGAKVMHRQAVEKIHSSLRIADMAFDINLLYALKRAGFKVLEVPTEWTDKIGSKVALGKTSLTMLLSVIRLRLFYSPFYSWLRPFSPLEAWIYKKLSAPKPRSGPPEDQGGKEKVGRVNPRTISSTVAAPRLPACSFPPSAPISAARNRNIRRNFQRASRTPARPGGRGIGAPRARRNSRNSGTPAGPRRIGGSFRCGPAARPASIPSRIYGNVESCFHPSPAIIFFQKRTIHFARLSRPVANKNICAGSALRANSSPLNFIHVMEGPHYGVGHGKSRQARRRNIAKRRVPDCAQASIRFQRWSAS